MFKLVTPIILVVLALGLVACGDDDDDPTPTPATDTATATPTNEVPEETVTPTSEPSAEPTSALPDFVQPGTIESDDSLEPAGLPQVVDVRIGMNDGYDRIVFEFEEDELPPWEVEYVGMPTACGSGKQVVVGGTASLQIQMFIAQAHTPAGQPTIPSNDIVVDYPAMVQGVQSCDFEALVTWVVGTNGALPFRVFALEEPTRLVVDVAHP